MLADAEPYSAGGGGRNIRSQLEVMYITNALERAISTATGHRSEQLSNRSVPMFSRRVHLYISLSGRLFKLFDETMTGKLAS